MEETSNAAFSDGEDRISRLPDALIHHILSFIDTKYAVQIGVLSKRWIHIWKSLPFLYFERRSFLIDSRYNERFIKLVDMVLLFRDDSDIQNIFVEWDNSAYKKTVIGHVDRWMLVAVRRNVQEITVRIGQKNHIMYKNPHQLFNCKSLRKLSMRKCGGGKSAAITLPKLMCFPQLQVLRLVGFSVSNVELMEELLSSCPVLKTFHISDFDIGTQHNLIVESTSLENLALDTSGCRHHGRTDHTVTSVTKLCAPNLKDFVCKGLMMQEYSFGNFSSLVSAAIKMKLKKKSKDETLDTYSKLPVEKKEVYAKSMMKFLVAVHKVASIRLSFGFLEVLSRAPNLLDCPHFCNLQYLQLEMWFTRDSLRSIAYLLRNSPIIYSVVITSMESNSEDIGIDWDAGLSLPGMLSRLKIVEIKEVVGCDSELKLLSYLLKNARVLEEVALFFRSSAGSPDRVGQVKQYRDKLRALPTASSNIKIMLF